MRRFKFIFPKIFLLFFLQFLFLALKEILPDVLTQLGEKQWNALKSAFAAPKKEGDKIVEATKEEEEEVPGLVDENFEEVSKQVD